MNESFSFHRIGLLMKNIFLQNWKKDLCIFLCMMGGMAIWKWLSMMYFMRVSDVDFLDFHLSYWPINIAVIATLMVLASLTFRKLGNPASGIMYLTLPASTFEKVVVNILLINVYYFVLLVASGLAGYALSLCMLAPMFPSVNVFVGFRLIYWYGFGYFALALTAGAAAMLFASVYFKKLALLWSFLIGVAVLFVTIAINIAIAHWFDGMMMRYYGLSQGAAEAMYDVILSLVTLFFWFMTWLRLRETEV